MARTATADVLDCGEFSPLCIREVACGATDVGEQLAGAVLSLVAHGEALAAVFLAQQEMTALGWLHALVREVQRMSVLDRPGLKVSHGSWQGGRYLGARGFGDELWFTAHSDGLLCHWGRRGKHDPAAWERIEQATGKPEDSRGGFRGLCLLSTAEVNALMGMEDGMSLARALIERALDAWVAGRGGG